MRVNVHHLHSTVSRHPSRKRKADRVIAANRNQDTALGDDPVGSLAHPGEVAVIVCSLYHNVPEVDHRDPAETIAVALDVIPTDRTVLWRLAVRELLP